MKSIVQRRRMNLYVNIQEMLLILNKALNNTELNYPLGSYYIF
jgi:hypothetical protein